MTEYVKSSALDAISRFHAERGIVPMAQKVAEKFDTSLHEAQVLIEEFLTQNGTKHQPKRQVPEMDNGQEKNVSETKVKWYTAFAEWMKGALDRLSLWLGISVDLVLAWAGGWTLGPDLVLKIGLVAILSATVLFLVRSWVRKQALLWLITMMSVLYMDTSMSLEATRVQSLNAKSDADLTDLTNTLKKAQDYLESLQAKQLLEGSGYRDQIETARADRDKAKEGRDNYISKPREQVKVSASSVATAIPDAILSGSMDRILLCAFFFNVFLGLQIGMVSATGVRWKDLFSRGVKNENA